MNRIFKAVVILSLFSLASMDAVRTGQKRRPVVTPTQAAQIDKAVSTATVAASATNMDDEVATFSSNVKQLSKCYAPTFLGGQACSQAKIDTLKGEIYQALPSMKKAAGTVVGLSAVVAMAVYLLKGSSKPDDTGLVGKNVTGSYIGTLPGDDY